MLQCFPLCQEVLLVRRGARASFELEGVPPRREARGRALRRCLVQPHRKGTAVLCQARRPKGASCRHPAPGAHNCISPKSPHTDHSQAYATDLAKDGAHAFSLKLSGSKHAFEAQSAAERDGWFAAVEKAIAEAKEAKEGIESSDSYKQHKETIGKSMDHVCTRDASRGSWSIR